MTVQLRGKDGSNGKDGANGKDGINGKDGVNGKDGAPGKDGPSGRDGAPGKDGPNAATVAAMLMQCSGAELRGASGKMARMELVPRLARSRSWS